MGFSTNVVSPNFSPPAEMYLFDLARQTCRFCVREHVRASNFPPAREAGFVVATNSPPRIPSAAAASGGCRAQLITGKLIPGISSHRGRRRTLHSICESSFGRRLKSRNEYLRRAYPRGFSATPLTKGDTRAPADDNSGQESVYAPLAWQKVPRGTRRCELFRVISAAAARLPARLRACWLLRQNL